VPTITDAAAAIHREISACLLLLEDDGSWERPTRLAGWSVADLAAHLALGQQLQAQAWRYLAEGDATPVTAEPAAGSPGQVREAIAGAAHALQEALAAAGDDALANVASMPYGPSPGAFLLAVAVMEAGVHRSELAAATGGDDALADDVVGAAFAVLGAFLPVLGHASAATARPRTAIRLEGPAQSLTIRRGDDGAWHVDGDPAGGTTTLRGSGSDLALFALGRRASDSAGLTGDGDEQVARQFKELFPGP
jgi:uncharacterized protein (TIGR03083 family)